MAPWDKFEDHELRGYLDDAMFFMVVLEGLDMHAAWKKLDGLWPDDMSPGSRDRDFFFHNPADTLALFFARGSGWWRKPEYLEDEGPMARYARFQAAQQDGSWERKKREAYP